MSCIKLGGHLQIDGHGVLWQLRQRQSQRGGVIDVLYLKLLLQVMPGRQHADDHTAAEGDGHDHNDGDPELFNE